MSGRCRPEVMRLHWCPQDLILERHRSWNWKYHAAWIGKDIDILSTDCFVTVIGKSWSGRMRMRDSVLRGSGTERYSLLEVSEPASAILVQCLAQEIDPCELNLHFGQRSLRVAMAGTTNPRNVAEVFEMGMAGLLADEMGSVREQIVLLFDKEPQESCAPVHQWWLQAITHGRAHFHVTQNFAAVATLEQRTAWTPAGLGNVVTVSPQTDPRAPYAKTPNTIRRRNTEDDAEEEAAIAKLVAEHAQTRAKSPTPYYKPGSAQRILQPQEYWE
ncbi:hypothetical protein EDB83DRAFT_2312720 [Lactarius deliciosus]|nr:hypothetical protein EDB83DRAFT_2312720 [Lactarius deliciosus]